MWSLQLKMQMLKNYFGNTCMHIHRNIIKYRNSPNYMCENRFPHIPARECAAWVNQKKL